MEKRTNIAALILLTTVLLGCQTVKYAGDDYEMYQSIVAKRCVVSTYQDGNVKSSKKNIYDFITITNVVESKQDWKRIEATTDGFRGSVYFNPTSWQTICGWRNWRKLDLPVTFES